jgi:hypothetical protein
MRSKTAFGQSCAGHPLSYINCETHSFWITASKIGPDRYQVREMDIKHTLFARPVSTSRAFPEGTVLTRNEVNSQFEKWTQDRRRERTPPRVTAQSAQPAG